MDKLDYRTYFFIKIAIVCIMIIILQNNSIMPFIFRFLSFIWLAVFSAQSVFVRFFFLKHPLGRSSLSEFLVSIVLAIASFVLIYFTSTVLVVPGSPWMLLLGGIFKNEKVKQLLIFSFIGISLLLFYMHVCILLYDEDTESAQLIIAAKQTLLVGVIVNGLAGSALNRAVAKDAFVFSIFLWCCLFVFILILPVIMRFILFKDRITGTRNRVLLFLVSYVLTSVFFCFFNYIPSAIVFVKSLMSFGFGNRYYPLSNALFNIASSGLLLFFLYYMHSGILGYEEDGDYSEDSQSENREQHITRNRAEYDPEMYKINSGTEWIKEEGWGSMQQESENPVIYNTGSIAEDRREAHRADNKIEEASAKKVKEKEKLIQTGAVIWLLGALINLSFFFWSLWFAFMIMPPTAMRFAFFKRPTTGLKDKIRLFLASYLAVSLLLVWTPIDSIPSFALGIGIYFFKAAPYASPSFSLFSLGTLFSLVSTLLLFFSSFYLHSAILSYGSDQGEER